MDFFVARLMSLNEHELSCLRSDRDIQNHLQQTHLLMESKLQQYNASTNASSNHSSLSSCSSAAIMSSGCSDYALDLRLSDHHQQQNNQLKERNLFHQQLQLQFQLQQQQYNDHHRHQQQQQQQQQQQLQHQQEKCYNYKKMKFIEWTSNEDGSSPTPPASSASTASTTTTLAPDDLVSPATNNYDTPLSKPIPTTIATTTTPTNHLLGLTVAATPTTGGKRYKGEFDEPNALEVELRLKLLMRDDNYHSKNSPLGECACILGSEFRDKTASSVLMMVEQWRQMPTEQRVTFKWDMNDLPKDIPLSDIKRFENLRREASSGRADFGGASKRKPLGIRGTRQFLLILYCLWGHPGRDDPMQREGYCPHCFAKIKKPNEQSTLVRVVNHFNMKHRRGVNPRT